MGEVKLNKSYVYDRIHKVLNSCTNRFQYVVATKYLDMLINRYQLRENISDLSISGIETMFIAYKHKVLMEFND